MTAACWRPRQAITQTAAAELGLALDLGAPVSRPLTRLLRAGELARSGRGDDAERELRATALEPVSPADWPDTLVARMSHVQGLSGAEPW